jgi:hypothetical protein
MADITTVETVTAGDYEVRVARTSDGQAWEAVVVDDSTGDPSPPSGLPMAGMVMMGAGTDTGGDDTDDDPPLGPPVTAPHRWVAVGFAIEAHEWGAIDESPVGVAEGYGQVCVDGTPLGELEGVDLSLATDDEWTVDANDIVGDLSGSFDTGGDS